jgi:hypothetical protein
VRLTDEHIAEIIGNITEETAEDEEYARRLAICDTCDNLLYKTTCRYCGCLVKFKAKLKSGKCAFPYQPKWV